MRTDILQHTRMLLHKMRDKDEPGSPLHHMAKSIEHVIDTWDGINLFERFTRNQFHLDPDYESRPEQDYLHDIGLMKHHLKCHSKTIKELDRWRWPAEIFGELAYTVILKPIRKMALFLAYLVPLPSPCYEGLYG